MTKEFIKDTAESVMTGGKKIISAALDMGNLFNLPFKSPAIGAAIESALFAGFPVKKVFQSIPLDFLIFNAETGSINKWLFQQFGNKDKTIGLSSNTAKEYAAKRLDDIALLSALKINGAKLQAGDIDFKNIKSIEIDINDPNLSAEAKKSAIEFNKNASGFSKKTPAEQKDVKDTIAGWVVDEKFYADLLGISGQKVNNAETLAACWKQPENKDLKDKYDRMTKEYEDNKENIQSNVEGLIGNGNKTAGAEELNKKLDTAKKDRLENIFGKGLSGLTFTEVKCGDGSVIYKVTGNPVLMAIFEARCKAFGSGFVHLSEDGAKKLEETALTWKDQTAKEAYFSNSGAKTSFKVKAEPPEVETKMNLIS